MIPFYERFLARFPTVESLASAPLGRVLKVWENMGYYGRARNLHRAARVVAGRFGGRIPDTCEELGRLPGVGAYTASAVLSFAFDKKVLALDGNVKRVLCRLFAVEQPIEAGETLERIAEIGNDLLPGRDSSSFNQGLMDLGAMICTPRNPLCGECPLALSCLAHRRGIQSDLPVSTQRPAVPRRHMTAGVIRDGRGRVLVAERPPRGLLGGLWKLPGGEKRRGEKPESALARTVREEVGVDVAAGERLTVIKHAFTHFRMSLHVFECRRLGGTPRPLGCVSCRWAGPRTLRSLPFSKADRRVLEIVTP